MIVKGILIFRRRLHHMRKVVFLCTFLSILFILQACQESTESETNEEQRATPVEVANVETGDFIVHKSVTGQIFPEKQVPVMLDQPAEVAEVHVKNGDTVKKDEKIVTVKTAMGNVSVKAPSDGVVAQLQTKEDEMVTNEEPLAFIIDIDHVEVIAQVTPLTRDLLEVDKELNVVIAKEKYKANVQSIDTLPNDTGQFTVTLRIDNEDDEIAPGEIAKISIPEKRVKKATIVPTEAIVTESDMAYIYVVDGEEAKKIEVEVVETQSDKTAIEADVEKGVEVIVNGQFTLTDGSEIEVVKVGNES